MTDDAQPFSFSQFIPGFDFLRNLAQAGSAAGAAGMPGLSGWVAPTLSVDELDKRIQELKTVQYWLEQNGHALKATIQALEVQKMTLSTLQGMNVHMEDVAQAFAQSTASAAAAMRDAAAEAVAPMGSSQTSTSTFQHAQRSGDERPEASAAGDDGVASAFAPAPAPAPAADGSSTGGCSHAKGAEASAHSEGAASLGVTETLKWWNALSQQFQQIAGNALKEAAQRSMPQAMGEGAPPAPAAAPSGRAARGRASAAAPAKKVAKKAGDKGRVKGGLQGDVQGDEKASSSASRQASKRSTENTMSPRQPGPTKGRSRTTAQRAR